MTNTSAIVGIMLCQAPRMGSVHKNHLLGKDQLPLQQLVHLFAVTVGYKPRLGCLGDKVCSNVKMLWIECKVMRSAQDTQSHHSDLSRAQPCRALTCRSLGQVEAVGMVHLGAAWLLTRDQLPSVPAAETLVLPLLHHLRLRPALHLRPPLELLGLLLREAGLALWVRQCGLMQGSALFTCSLPAAGENCKPCQQKSHCQLYLRPVQHLQCRSVFGNQFTAANSSQLFWKSLEILHQSLAQHGIYPASNSRMRSWGCLGSLSSCCFSQTLQVKAVRSPGTQLIRSLPRAFLHFFTFITSLSIFSLNLSVLSLDLFVPVSMLLFSTRITKSLWLEKTSKIIKSKLWSFSLSLK